MNVGITRARHGLFVVAHVATLRLHPTWGALMDHVEGLGGMVTVATATQPLLPLLPVFPARGLVVGEGGRGAKRARRGPPLAATEKEDGEVA